MAGPRASAVRRLGRPEAVETDAYSHYNALMFRINRRFANNLAVNFNYTWSHIMDTGDNDSDGINNPVLHPAAATRMPDTTSRTCSPST